MQKYQCQTNYYVCVMYYNVTLYEHSGMLDPWTHRVRNPIIYDLIIKYFFRSSKNVEIKMPVRFEDERSGKNRG